MIQDSRPDPIASSDPIASFPLLPTAERGKARPSPAGTRLCFRYKTFGAELNSNKMSDLPFNAVRLWSMTVSFRFTTMRRASALACSRGLRVMERRSHMESICN